MSPPINTRASEWRRLKIRAGSRLKCTFSIGVSVIAQYPARAANVTVRPISAADLPRIWVQPKQKAITSQEADIKLNAVATGQLEMLPRYWSPAPNTAPAAMTNTIILGRSWIEARSGR